MTIRACAKDVWAFATLMTPLCRLRMKPGVERVGPMMDEFWMWSAWKYVILVPSGVEIDEVGFGWS